MPFKLDIRENKDHLVFELEGIRTRETNARVADAIREACTRHHVQRVLVDASALEKRLGVLDAHAGPTTDFPKDVLSKQIKVAVLDCEEFEETFRFFETVARNAGYNIRMFVNREEARQWLLSDEM